MKSKTIIGVCLLFLAMSLNTYSQDKIGHANVELILNYMPESATMNQSLGSFQKKLAEQLKIKEDYARSKFAEYQAFVQANPNATEAELKPKQEELQKLDQEIREFAAKSEQQLMEKRQELLAPIVEKLKVAIDGIAKADGFTYILNSVDGSGVSIVLHGPEDRDLTKQIMTKLGIDIPEN